MAAQKNLDFDIGVHKNHPTAPGVSTSGDQELSLAMALLAELVQDGDEEENVEGDDKEDHGEDDDKEDHAEDDDKQVLSFFH